MKFVFDQRQSTKDFPARQYFLGHRSNDGFKTVFPRPAMGLTSAGLFAQADRHHLEESALDGARKIGVWLDAVHHQNAICVERVSVHEDLEALRSRTKQHRL